MENENEDIKSIEKNVMEVLNNKNFGENKTFEVKRHGIKKTLNNNNVYHRIVKVRFNTTTAASTFIKQYRSVHQPKVGARSPFARRDLTRPELQLQNYLKKQVKEINEKHGLGTASYRNLKIYYKTVNYG